MIQLLIDDGTSVECFKTLFPNSGITIQDVDSQALLEVALVENVHRQDLNAIELAHAFRALHESGATQEEVGRRFGLDRSTVANHLRLLELPSEFQQDVEEAPSRPATPRRCSR